METLRFVAFAAAFRDAAATRDVPHCIVRPAARLPAALDHHANAFCNGPESRGNQKRVGTPPRPSPSTPKPAILSRRRKVSGAATARLFGARRFVTILADVLASNLNLSRVRLNPRST